jgi:beta-xylosidase
LDNGQSWFISFKSTGFSGRICYLNPVTWGTDDWPVFGDNGKSVDVWKKPDVGKTYPITRPQTSDEFDSLSLSPIWQWNHNPIDDNWSLLVHPGYLRLRTEPATSPNQARNTLTQQLWDNSGLIDAKFDTSNLVDGQKSGLAFMSGGVLNWVGPSQLGGVRRVSWNNDIGPVLKSNDLWVRGTYQGDQARLYFSFDGKQFVDTGQNVTLKFADWKGARVALMAYGPKGGALDVDYFRYSYGK